VFAALLDGAKGGSLSIRPRGSFTTTRSYVEQTPVLRTEFSGGTGRACLWDLMPMNDGMQPMRPMRELLRVIEGVVGTAELEINLDLRPDYARRCVAPTRRGRTGWVYSWSNEIVVVATDIELQAAGNALRGIVRLAPGERRYLSLAYAKGDPAVIPPLRAAADARLAETVEWWQRWAAGCRYDGPHRSEVLRSLLTLKLMSYAPSGAIVAAPTTSLPEVPGQDRNWDYRYCWLRDAGLTTQALLSLGYFDEARSFLSWLLHATRLTWPELRIMYDVFGRTRLEECELAHLEGYRASRPVRIGNGAYRQRQLDVYGEVVMAADAVAAACGHLDPAESRLLAGLGTVVCRQWREPDSGIWESRGPRRHYTFSKVMCWVALDRLLKLQAKGIVTLSSARLERFRQERAAIAATVEQHGYNATLDSYTGELDGDRLDASLLLMACTDYKSADDPRMRATYDRLQQRLGHGVLLDRYERPPDDKRAAEGAFGICSFWAIDNLAKRGDVAEAERRFRHMLTFANDLGLYAEEIEVASGLPLGNFPQAFTHVGLINAAVAIETARQAGRS
jgi:GH15 family glucan-1,4-alpha-glucosidase